MEEAMRMAATLHPIVYAATISTAAAIPARMNVRDLEDREDMEALERRTPLAFAHQGG